ncbi:MAG: MAPEG family protein [Pontixanthobacter sp.]
MQAQILAPAAVLIGWSLVMLAWLAFTRFPAMGKLDPATLNAKPGGRGQDLEGRIPDKVNWKSHNYTHLMEQPTIFYPTVIILAMMGTGTLDVIFAWAYVALRIVHSIYQATVNIAMVRFGIFALSTLCLIKLVVSAIMVTVFANPGVVS